MSRNGRIRAEMGAEWRSFLRRRTAVFFTFFFPILLVVIFGALVRTEPDAGGLFAESPAYYIAGYIAVVVLFTPLSRVSSSVARNRESNRFEKLSTTPLTRMEWLLAHTIVSIILVSVASIVILIILAGLTGATPNPSPIVIPFVAIGVAVFSGLGAIIGRIADSQDGAIAAANSIALPLLFLSETFIPLHLLPGWLHPLINWLPLTPFARGVRAVTYSGGPWIGELLLLCVFALIFWIAGARAIPRSE